MVSLEMMYMLIVTNCFTCFSLDNRDLRRPNADIIQAEQKRGQFLGSTLKSTGSTFLVRAEAQFIIYKLNIISKFVVCIET